jgi:hypothetical protein
MAFIPVPNYISLVAQFGNTGVVAENRFFLFGGTPVVETDLEEVCTTFIDVWDEALSGNCVAAWALEALIARDMSEEEGIQLVFTTGLPSVGTNAGGAQPNQVTSTVTWETGLVGRSARGRTYTVGIPDTFIALGNRQLTPTAQGLLSTRWETFRTAFDTAGHALAVVSFSEGGVPRTEGRPLVVTSSRVPFPLATQRRRLR